MVETPFLKRVWTFERINSPFKKGVSLLSVNIFTIFNGEFVRVKVHSIFEKNEWKGAKDELSFKGRPYRCFSF
jgi:hypothetical protein